jgi:hypothetical protein
MIFDEVYKSWSHYEWREPGRRLPNNCSLDWIPTHKAGLIRPKQLSQFVFKTQYPTIEQLLASASRPCKILWISAESQCNQLPSFGYKCDSRLINGQRRKKGKKLPYFFIKLHGVIFRKIMAFITTTGRTQNLTSQFQADGLLSTTSIRHHSNLVSFNL